VKANGSGWTARCPAHDDQHASLSIAIGNDGRLLVKCHVGCTGAAILTATGLNWKDLFPRPEPATATGDPASTKVYEVRDADGHLVAEHVREDRPEGKRFWWRRSGGVRGLGGIPVRDLPLFGSELLRDRPQDPVVVVEGEKATQAARRFELLAVGTVTGAAGCPSPKALEQLRGRTIVLWPDNDTPGLDHMRRLAVALKEIAASVRTASWPAGTPEGHDAADLLAAGKNTEDVLVLLGLHPDAPAAERESEPATPSGLRLLRPLSAAAIFTDESLGTRRWMWADYIPEGSLVLLAGFMKTGKTTLVYSLVGAAVYGRTFLGRDTTKTGALVLAVEEHLRDVRRHLQAAGIGPDAPVYVHVGMLPATQEGLEEVRAFMAERSLGLLVVDTLTRFWGVRDENDNSEVIAALGPLLDLAHTVGITVLLVHHAGKNEEEESTGREIRGASGTFGMVDQALILKRVRGGAPTARSLRALGRYPETPREVILDFDEETATFTVIESKGKTVDERREVRARKLVGYVAENPGCSRRDAVVGAKVNRQEGYAVLGWLLQEARIAERDGGLHVAPGSGSGPLRNHSEPPEPVPGSGAPYRGGTRNHPEEPGELAEPAGTSGPGRAPAEEV